jgi:hypothetical protein
METGNYMEMEVRNCLTRGGSVVYYNIESITLKFMLYNFGNFLDSVYYKIELIFGDGEEIGIMGFGNDERVSKVDGVYIEKGEHFTGFEEDFGMLCMINYVTKDTIHS